MLRDKLLEAHAALAEACDLSCKEMAVIVPFVLSYLVLRGEHRCVATGECSVAGSAAVRRGCARGTRRTDLPGSGGTVISYADDIVKPSISRKSVSPHPFD